VQYYVIWWEGKTVKKMLDENFGRNFSSFIIRYRYRARMVVQMDERHESPHVRSLNGPIVVGLDEPLFYLEPQLSFFFVWKTGWTCYLGWLMP
jgi:hypothetical protein